MARFYYKDNLEINIICTLTEDIARHMFALRMNIHDSITLFNGDGFDYKCQIVELSKKIIRVEVIDKQINNNNNHNKLILALSMISIDNVELVLRSGVELGVTDFILFNSERTQRISPERLNNKWQRFQQIIISACEQTNISNIPNLVREVYAYSDVLEMAAECKIIFSPWHTTIHLENSAKFNSSLLVFGPEGGFTNDEVLNATAKGFLPICLGKRVLRAETAALAGVSYYQSIYGDFK